MKASDKYLNKWLTILERCGVSKSDYDKKEKELQKRFGKTPTSSDIVWGLWNDLIMRPHESLEELSYIYYNVGRFMNDKDNKINL